MKKSSLLIIVILCVLCSGCFKQPIKLPDYEISLYKDKSYMIPAPAHSHYEYHSLNKFCASVSTDGLILANHVGETDILVSNNYDEKKIHVTVEPTYMLYTEPYINFGENRNAIKARYGTPYQENANAAIFPYKREGFALMVTFDQNNQVVSYVVVVPNNYYTDLALFLFERYELDRTGSNNTSYFMNAYSVDEASLFVTVLPYNANLWFVIYEPESRNAKFSSFNPTFPNEITDALATMPR